MLEYLEHAMVEKGGKIHSATAQEEAGFEITCPQEKKGEPASLYTQNA